MSLDFMNTFLQGTQKETIEGVQKLIDDKKIKEKMLEEAQKYAQQAANHILDESQEAPKVFEGIDLMLYTKRIEIQPGESATLTASFNGDTVGIYKDSFHFVICDSEYTPFHLPLHGEVKYPDIDRNPLTIFNKTT